MPRMLPLKEELDLIERLTYPNFAWHIETLSEKMRVAGEVASRSPQQATLLGGMALSEPCVVAGLTPELVEYIVRSGALSQKHGLHRFSWSPAAAEELREIARRMDLDAGVGARVRQDAAETVLAYLADIAPAIYNDRIASSSATPIA